MSSCWVFNGNHDMLAMQSCTLASHAQVVVWTDGTFVSCSIDRSFATITDNSMMKNTAIHVRFRRRHGRCLLLDTSPKLDSYSLLLIHYSGIPRWLYMPHIKSMNKFDFFPWNVCRGGLSSILD